MSDGAAGSRLRLDRLSRHAPSPFEHVFSGAERKEIAAALDLPGIERMRITGRLVPEEHGDLRLEARLTARAVQECVVTFAPVRSNLDEKISRHYLARIEEPPPGESEMGDEDEEELPRVLDLGELAQEVLSLTLPHWPRAEGVDEDEWQALPPGAAPITKEKPFAGLAGLRERMGKDEDEDTDEG